MDIFTSEQQDFRQVVRAFLAKEVKPYFAEWEHAGAVPRQLYRRLGELGIIGLGIPEQYGGGGQTDYRFNVVLQEEINRATFTLGSLRTHMDVVLPYFQNLANAEQRDAVVFRIRIGRAVHSDRDDRAGHGVGFGRCGDHRAPRRRPLRA